MTVDTNEISVNAKGGTEMMAERLRSSLTDEQKEIYQIIPSRVRELDPDKVRIFWAHDLPNDDESKHLANHGWEKFHKIVFVSHWQQQAYINYFGIPWSKTVVLQNAVEPSKIETVDKLREKYEQPGQIKLVYHTTPHRGLNILFSSFSELAKKHDDIHLDVFSSFEIYGWKERDNEYQELFDRIKEHPQITYHGSKSNEEVRRALEQSHIFAYPSIWPETSCIALMEAMMSGCVCIHPDFGALPETAANWTNMYTWEENMMSHANLFTFVLDQAIGFIKNKQIDANLLISQKAYAETFYNWNIRKLQWQSLLLGLKDEKRDLPKNVGPDAFIYRT